MLDTGRSILVVEDEPVTAMLIKDALEKAGYGICGTARTAGEAIEAAARLRPDLCIVDLNLAFRFTEGYMTKNDLTKGLFGEPGSKVPGLFDMDPKIRRAKADDGFYRWKVTGPLARLNFRPAPRSAGGRAARQAGTAEDAAKRD